MCTISNTIIQLYVEKESGLDSKSMVNKRKTFSDWVPQNLTSTLHLQISSAVVFHKEFKIHDVRDVNHQTLQRLVSSDNKNTKVKSSNSREKN